MEVKQNHVIILVDTAEWPDEIDENRARAAKARAEERLQRRRSEAEYISLKQLWQERWHALKLRENIISFNWSKVNHSVNYNFRKQQNIKKLQW